MHCLIEDRTFKLGGRAWSRLGGGGVESCASRLLSEHRKFVWLLLVASTKCLCSQSSLRTDQFPGGTAEVFPLFPRLTVFPFLAFLTSTLKKISSQCRQSLFIFLILLCSNSSMALSFQRKWLKGKYMPLFFSFPSLLQMPTRAKKYRGLLFGMIRARGRKGKYKEEKNPAKLVSISKTPSYQRNDQTQILC